MVGLLLALVVVAIVVSLFGGWIFGIAIGAVAIILFIVFVAGIGRRAASR
jgi:energy-coupling factor transporter transmembrane protein EcfT